MNAFLVKIFIIELFVVGFAYFVLSKHKLEIRGLQRLMFMAVLVTPIFVVFKGVMSAIYISDLLGWAVLLCAIFRYRKIPASNSHCVLWLMMLLIVAPIFSTLINGVISDFDSNQFDSRGLFALCIWIYRNIIYLCVFIVAASFSLNKTNFETCMKTYLLLNTGVVLIGIVDYIGLYDFSVYEVLLASVSPDLNYRYTNTTLGWGFLGMFRGSVGQWFANSFLLSLSSLYFFKGRWRVIAFIVGFGSLVMVFCSFSRAGMVAVVLGPLIMLLCFGAKRTKLIPIFLLFGIMVLPILSMDDVSERVLSIETYASSKKINRVDGWFKALNYLGDNPKVFIFGNGATNREGVFDSIGAYGAHNEYIDVVFRSGIFGFFFLLVFIFSILNSFLLVKKKSVSIECKGWMATGVALLLSNCVIGFTQDHIYRDYSGFSSGLMMFLLYGVFYSLKSDFEEMA